MSFPIFDTMDAVPEGFREAYEERDGRWVAKVEDVAGLKGALQKERSEREKASKAARDAQSALDAAKAEKEAVAAGLTSEKLKEIQDQVAARFKSDLDERDALKAEVRSLKLDGKVKDLLTKADVIDADDAWKLIRENFDLTEDGKPILKADPTADVAAYIKGDLLKAKPYLFKGSQAEGGGAAGIAGKGVGKSVPVSKLTGPELRSYIEANGIQAYQEALDADTRAAYATEAQKIKAA